MSVLTFRIGDELKKALQGYAKLYNKSVSEVVIEAIREKLEDEEDYQLALMVYETIEPSSLKSFDMLCQEVNIDYDEI